MLTTKLTSRRGTPDENWDYAVKHGHSELIQGHRVLLLGAADYVHEDGRVLSINSDYFDFPAKGIRWEVNPACVGTEIDRLALEFFGVTE